MAGGPHGTRSGKEETAGMSMWLCPEMPQFPMETYFGTHF